MKIDNSLPFYEASAWEAEQMLARIDIRKKALLEFFQREKLECFFVQPILGYIADFYFPDKKTFLFAAWEEHEHGEAYFRELRMQQEIEEKGYAVKYYTELDLADFNQILKRIQS